MFFFMFLTFTFIPRR